MPVLAEVLRCDMLQRKACDHQRAREAALLTSPSDDTWVVVEVILGSGV